MLGVLVLVLGAAPAAATPDAGPSLSDGDDSDDGDAAIRSSATAHRYTYEVRSRGDVRSDLGTFRLVAGRTLYDARGWSLGGSIEFDRVSSGGDFRLILASPEAVDAAHEVCSAEYSCRVGDDVYINDRNWRRATSAWRNAGGELSVYRQYVINHEVGHWLGFGHEGCTGAGDRAPVMQQQSISLDGCEPNGWPREHERRELSQRTGAPAQETFRDHVWLDGDVTGDGADDVVGFDTRTGRWIVGVSTGSGYEFSTWSRFSTGQGWQAHHVADVTGDGAAEVLSYHRGTGNWIVQTSTGSSFEHRVWARFRTTSGWRTHEVADVTGDGTSELVSFHGGTGNWVVTRDLGDRRSSAVWGTYRTTSGWEVLVGDVDASGTDDVVTYHSGTGAWIVNQATGSSFDRSRWATYRSSGWQTHDLGDADGDGRADLFSYHPGTGNLVLGRSTGASFRTGVWRQFGARDGWATHHAADVVGDERAEWVSVHAPTGRVIVTRDTSSGVRSSIWGELPTTYGWTHHAPTEATGDARADVVHFNIAAGTWWVSASRGGTFDVDRWADP